MSLMIYILKKMISILGNVNKIFMVGHIFDRSVGNLKPTIIFIWLNLITLFEVNFLRFRLFFTWLGHLTRARNWLGFDLVNGFTQLYWVISRFLGDFLAKCNGFLEWKYAPCISFNESRNYENSLYIFSLPVFVQADLSLAWIRQYN